MRIVEPDRTPGRRIFKFGEMDNHCPKELAGLKSDKLLEQANIQPFPDGAGITAQRFE
jgi:hypothetical protein